MSIKTLKTNLENAVNEIIKAFEEKQEVSFQFFVSDDVTGVACFGDVLYLNISDIWHDLLTEQSKGLIFEWHEECLENKNKTINYNSYCMGLRFEDVKSNKINPDCNDLYSTLKISFDFDQTLSELPMQELAKKYIELGAEVYITTSRTEHKDGLQYDNSDLFEVADKLGIKRENITFTNYDDKYKFVKAFDIHFDDDEQEIALINEFPSKCIGFLYQPNFNNQIADF